MRTARYLSLAIFLSGAASAPAAFADLPSLTEIGRLVPGFTPAAAGPFAIADFDHDGIDDIVVPGQGGNNTLLQVVGRSPSGIAVKQALVLPESWLARVFVRTSSGTPHLLTIATNGIVREFDGWPLVELRSFDLGMSVSAAAVGDVDGDGQDELVVSSNWSANNLVAYDLVTLTQRWSLPNSGGSDLLLAQLDADPALEIVVASNPGLIIDGATQAVDWSYKDGFGAYLASGHFGANPQFVAARDWDLFTVFQSEPYSPLWDAVLFDIDAIAAADLDGDGIDEIIEGDGQWGAVNVYDSQTHAVRISIPHSTFATSAVGAVDIEGDGAKTIAYSPRQASFSNDQLFALYHPQDGSLAWAISQVQTGSYTTVSVGPTGPAGELRLMFGTWPLDFQTYGLWTELGAWSGQQSWQSDIADNPYPASPAAAFAIEQGSSSAAGFVVAGADVVGGAKIVAIDGLTHDVRWQIGGQNGQPLAERYVTAMTSLPTPAGDLLGAACVGAPGGSRIFTFDAISGAASWESIAVGNGDPCIGIMAGDFGVAHPLIAAVLPSSIRAFDATTHLLAWSLVTDADGATLLESGASDREFVVFSDTQLFFYDASTRAALRQFDLGAPIEAVREINSDIHTLLVSAGGRLLLVDGLSGSIAQSSDFLGTDLGAHNQLEAYAAGSGVWFVGVGSSVGVFRLRLTLTDAIFDDGFDG